MDGVYSVEATGTWAAAPCGEPSRTRKASACRGHQSMNHTCPITRGLEFCMFGTVILTAMSVAADEGLFHYEIQPSSTVSKPRVECARLGRGVGVVRRCLVPGSFARRRKSPDQPQNQLLQADPPTPTTTTRATQKSYLWQRLSL